MAEPIVHQGARGADARGLFRQQTGQPTVHVPDVAPATEGEAIFVSTSETFRIVLWERWDKSTTFDRRGNRLPDRRTVQFLRALYRTKDPEEIDALRKATSYGIHFYELADLQARAREAKMASALAAVDDPEIAEALRVKLGVQEMPLPKRIAEPFPALVTQESVQTKEPERVKPIR